MTLDFTHANHAGNAKWNIRSQSPAREYLYLPRERQRSDDVGTRGEECETHQIVRRANRSELGSLS